jgi:hypothetical protein
MTKIFVNCKHQMKYQYTWKIDYESGRCVHIGQCKRCGVTMQSFSMYDPEALPYLNIKLRSDSIIVKNENIVYVRDP